MTATDPIPADQLLAEADALVAPSPPLPRVISLAQVLLADALDLVDGDASPRLFPAGAMNKYLQSAAFYIERALAELGHLTPARQPDQSSAAVGLNAIATPGGPGTTPHWHDFLLPRDVRGES